MKTTNTLLAIITIILVIFAAEHYGNLFDEYQQKQIEMQIWKENKKLEDSLSQSQDTKNYYKTLDSLDKIDQELLKSLK